MENQSEKKNETDESAPSRRRKDRLKFAPKAAPKIAPKIIPEAYRGGLYREPREESQVAAIDKELMLRLRLLKSTDSLGSRAKDEKKETPIQVAFGQADHSVLRTFSTPRSSSSQVAFGQADPSILRTFSTPRNSSSGVALGVPAVKLPKKHNDPWDYTSTNYPVTLPLGRAYSRDSDLDEDELGQSSSRAHVGEPTAAEELGLVDKVDEPQLLFFQLPCSLPLPRHADSVAETDTDTNVDAKSDGKRKRNSIHGCKLRELPGGFMGKILVYKSGKVKMKLGDAHFDVSAGSNCSFAQEAVAVDTREKHLSSLGEVGKFAIVTPDLDYLLGCVKME